MAIASTVDFSMPSVSSCSPDDFCSSSACHPGANGFFVFDVNGSAQTVVYSGIIHLDKRDGYGRMQISVRPGAATERFCARLNELTALQRGWYDGRQGEPLDVNALHKLACLFSEHFMLDELKTYAYPTLDNSIQLEWDIQRWRVSLEIDLATFEGDFFALDLDSGREATRTLDMNTPSGWQWLREWLRDMKVKA